MKTIVCISGKKGSGKDSITEYLIKNHKAVRVAFADQLKDRVSVDFCVPREYFDLSSLKELPLCNLPVKTEDEFSKIMNYFLVREFRTEKGFLPEVADLRVKDGFLQTFVYDWENLYWTPRALLILMGPSYRSIRNDYWTNLTFDKINHLINENDLIVVSDLRYLTELNQIKERFGDKVKIIRVNRDVNKFSTDPSECDLDNYEFQNTIENNGSLEDLYNKVDEMMDQLITN